MKKSDRGIAFIVCGAVAVYLLATSLFIFFSESASPDAMRILGILNILVLALCLFLTCHLGRKRRAAQKEAAARTENSGRAKAVYLNNISHDLRTRLNAIIGYASIARKQAEAGSSVLDFLDKIGTAGNELLELADQTLDISRVDSGSVVLEEEPFDIVDKSYRLIDSLSGDAGLKGLRIVPVVKSIKDSRVLGDVGRLRQLLGNILDNAVKYTPDGGLVFFTLTQAECSRPGYSSYVFTVEDNGIGMSAEFVEMLFDPFAREKSPEAGKVNGAGLGMYVVKTLVDMMGGSVTVDSVPRRGTKVSVTLTFKKQDDAGMKPSAYCRHSGFDVLKGRRALVVEDNEMNREIATMILQEQGMEVETADDGDVAVEKMEAVAGRNDWGYYDFILMDIQMPRMNGDEAARAIRNLPTPEGVHVPIIAMTANAFAEDRQNALTAGMDAHIAKPVELETLLKTLVRFV